MTSKDPGQKRAGRRRTERALWESEESYRSLFDNMLNGFAYCRMLLEHGRPTDFIYLHVNPAFETLTGLKNVVGKKASEVIPGIQESDQGLLEIYGRVALTGIPERFEIYVDSLKMWFSISVYSPRKEYFVAVFDVITERKRAEQKITHLNRVYVMLSKINEAIVRTHDRQHLFETACRVAVEHGLFRLAWIGIVEPETLLVKPVAFHGSEEGYLNIIRISAREDPEGLGPTGSAIREGKHSVCNDLQDDRRMLPWRDEALKRGYRASAAFPIRAGGLVIGSLSIYSAEPHFFDDEEIKLLDEVTEDISFAVDFLEKEEHRKLAEEALCASEAELRNSFFARATINMILGEALEIMPIEEFLQKALNMILSVPWIAFEPRGSIYLVEDDREIMVMKAESNIPDLPKKLCANIPFGNCLCGKAAQTQQVEFAAHTDNSSEICCEGIPPHGHYAVPILSGGRTLGVLSLYLKEAHRRNPEEEDFLRNVAHTLAGIIMRRKAEDRVEYLAYYDGLTGLPNRNLFIDRLTQGVARAQYSKKLVAVLTLDVDRFKSINDTYGLETGDAALKAVAKTLSLSIRAGDTAARTGGDGFGILLVDVAQPDDIIYVVEKVINNVSRETIYFKEKEIVLTISCGISVHPNDGKDASELIKNAELALARAKQEGRKNYQFYTEGMDARASQFVLMERNLFKAMRDREFILHYQPYWDIGTRKLKGMEALIRWQSPEFGLVSPGVFIPVLEDTRMIIEVGEWIIRTAVAQVGEWQSKGYQVVPVSVNLSLIQFRQKDIAKMVEGIVRENGVHPSLLTLEMTESAFMQDIEFTNSVLEDLKNIGVSISIDDFGTGYSSLAHLKRFPIDNLKIDMSFIREIAGDPDTASIVTAIIAMAHALNLKTIAEGIETEEQWRILRLLRCNMGQGFYLSKPLSAADAEEMFA